MQPSLRDLDRLAYKYRTIGDLRRARAAGEPIPERAVFRELAVEFPGVLTELDTLPLDEIDRRALLLERAAKDADAEIDPWMAWIFAYHALARAALHIRLRGARARSASRSIDPALASSLARDASARAGVEVDRAFAEAVLRPPKGRINAVLYERLSAAFNEPADTIKRALFPGLRGRAP